MKNCQSSDLDTEKTIEELVKYETGKTLTFGSYYQNDENTKTPIEWIVLSREENKALLISKYLLDTEPYNTTQAKVTWENCTLRKWLNNDFFNIAFNKTEKKKIVETTIVGEYADELNNIKDNVFLLNNKETLIYFEDNKARECQPTHYTVSKGIFVADDGYSWWWLRSFERNQIDAPTVFNTGGVYDHGDYVSAKGIGVRPALWIDINS